ncbi:MAG TPA: hypothetical protein IGS52_13150 [Oscillatoriaceae cyanobacterium M33_DOE_052]|nr:hypothetical protein [Oscillatoriaceae cyanobacterium M33_DOE_052]
MAAPRLPISPSPRLPISPSPRLPISPSQAPMGANGSRIETGRGRWVNLRQTNQYYSQEKETQPG